ncbi:hypothetical protein [Fluviicola sp.]|uniref:hypothetical protein n=1 Tax=Fluviicola sp. TaxID=1917219 RepID=UPI00261A9475|nr:hypothetical protein [Fluviicola sp.]
MKTGLLLITCALFFTVSCKKKKTETDNTPKTTYSLKHSGFVDSQTFSLDSNNISSQLIQTSEWHDWNFKNYSIRTWLKGPYLNDSVYPGMERLSLDFSFVFEYPVQELDLGCSCPPPLTAALLAAKINDASQWNDASESKEVIITAWENQSAGGTFGIVNPQISAQAIGNAIRINGTIDSLRVGIFSQPRYLTNLHFDYTIPIYP